MFLVYETISLMMFLVQETVPITFFPCLRTNLSDDQTLQQNFIYIYMSRYTYILIRDSLFSASKYYQIQMHLYTIVTISLAIETIGRLERIY